MKNKTPISKKTTAHDLFSDHELSRFLLKLANQYNDKVFGNIKLSASLRDLAGRLKNDKNHNLLEENSKKNIDYSYEYYVGSREKISDVTVDWVINIIKNNKATKKYLVDIGHFRFGIPEASLKKLNIEGVRNVILNSCSHEMSIKTIENAASSSGKTRKT
ncbi:hypothetical protein [Gluconobacter japonicus]|uniref:Uncharacterized protein n=1 Tax=Gluconobacter japonicus TaxID=376620 RepID=A0A9Q2FI15_GLUJA|nr:hypothetical protein [Gluconobacter japonicus]MBF0869742.1 hypothetical protein [Gluconobacter japonicus]